MARFLTFYASRLTLARLKAWILFVYHIYATFTANDAAIFISGFQCFKRIRDFHRIFPRNLNREGGNIMTSSLLVNAILRR